MSEVRERVQTMPCGRANDVLSAGCVPNRHAKLQCTTTLPTRWCAMAACYVILPSKIHDSAKSARAKPPPPRPPPQFGALDTLVQLRSQSDACGRRYDHLNAEFYVHACLGRGLSGCGY